MDLEVFKNSDALIVITEWDEYLQIDWNKVSLAMRRIFSFKGIVNIISQKNTKIWVVGNGEL